MGELTGEQKVDYDKVEQICLDMSGIVGDISAAYNIMNHNYLSTENEGEFAVNFERLRIVTETMVSDIKTFIDQYAEMALAVASCYLELDLQIQNIINNK